MTTKKNQKERRNRALALLIFGCVLFVSPGPPSHADQSVAKPELVIQSGHSSRVNCIVFAPAGSWLASGAADNSIRVWNVDSGLELRALLGHQNWVKALAVSSDGQLVASGGNDHKVKVWNVASGREIITLAGHEGAIEALSFSPDSRWVFSGGADNTIRVWEIASGRQLQTLKSHTSAITSLAISSDGKTLASGSADGSVKLWNTTYWSPRTLNQQIKKISTIAFSPDDRTVVSGSAGGMLVSWDASSGKLRFTMSHGQAAVLAARFINDREVVSAAADGTIVSWNAATGKQNKVIAGNADGPEMLSASFSHDGKLIAATTGDRSIEIRNVAEGKFARTLGTHSAAFFSVAFSRDGRWLAAGANDRSVRLWQIATGREMPNLSGHTGWVQTVAFSPDNRQLASGSNSGEVKLWDLNSGREVYGQLFAGDRIHAIAFSSDGKWLAAAGTAQTIHVLDLSTKQTRQLTGHEAEITSLAFVGDSSVIASASVDKTIRLWDVASAKLAKTLPPLSDQVNALAVSPDGHTLAAGTADKKIELFSLNASAVEFKSTLVGHTGEVFTLAFSRDGRGLASAGQDGTVRIWEPKSRKALRTITGDSGETNGLDFSSDSRFVVAANADGSMAIWNAENTTLEAVLVSIPGSEDWLAVTPGGLFDGSHAAWKFLLWRFAQDTFKVAPVESFFNEFYYPGLLADVLARKNPKPKQDIVQKDRRQPSISIQTEGSAAVVTNRTLKLRLEIAEAPADGEYRQGSGARDLRLFRNGLLVQAWPGDVLQGASQRVIETSLPIVAGENQFTAYAFNRDNVKSADSALTVSGGESLRRTGAAYLLVIGVSKYANPQYNLNYSVADATEIAAQLKSQQELLRRYHPIEVISLLNQDATKENILLALKLLAGSFAGPLPKDAAADLAKIKPAQPEDAVVFYFSGHGTAQGDRFYLIPHDLGYQGKRSDLDQTGLATILSHSVSDIELEETLKPIDVDQLLLVIDACNSGQALQAADERRGPMNARGLAQLAYEKGMYVLTASQSDEVAFESAGLKHSYLAYALVEEGIKSGAADADHNGQVFLNEWFNYATDRVPTIRGQKMQAGKELEEVDEDEKRVQRPRVFNMREGGAERFVIARLAGSAQSN